MEWDVEIHQDPKFIEFVTKGIADKDGSLQMALEIAETMKQNRITKALIDHRNIKSVSGGSAEVYNRPKILRLAGVILGIRIAEVIKPDHLGHFKFLETMCNNFGYKFSVFCDRESALDWLLS